MSFMPSGVTFKGHQAKAVYTPSVVPLYKHNAFIEALPPMDSMQDIIKRMERRPAYDAQDRRLPAAHRIQFVSMIRHYFEPLPNHVELIRRFSSMIPDGYMTRNPISAEWRRQINAGFPDLMKDPNDETEQVPIIQSSAAGFAMVGTSGGGKTTAIQSALSLYPQVITHCAYHGQPFSHKQLVWLKIDCPYDGNLRGLCLNFFQAIDDVLDTRYYAKYAHYKSPRDIVPVMATLAAVLGLGVLVIDEIQRLSTENSGGQEGMLNFFVHLVDVIGVPVVLVGTYQAMPLLTSSFAQTRRAAGQGDMIWSHMTPDATWDHLISRLWRYQWTNVETKLTPALKHAIYSESVGIIDIAVKLYMLAQWAVIGTKDESITAEVIHGVARESLRLARPILNALRNNDLDTLQTVRDIHPLMPELRNYLKAAQQRIEIEGSLNTVENQVQGEGEEASVTSQLIRWLVEGGIDYETAVKACNDALAKYASTTVLAEVRKYAYARAVELEQAKDEGAPKKSGNELHKTSGKKVTYLPGSLIEMFKVARKNKELMYNKLEDVGMLKNVDEFL
ncbi:ATP-binding protein [Alicyclobacillus sp. SO9]|uniref:ATP-binding protein n=1 Tax=Alicyclobacillus sp. SO9 TaxID=2665646 RepID=UPI0018E7C9BB|nr:ATP-binding protein [Alicyclobacillus sp. SO9]QQE78485.1 ATP-binding protein [Alicyclobacillus sp. SO9]